jgi:hypothetical protein
MTYGPLTSDMTDNPHVLRLAAYRLERDLSFVQLAAQMAEAGYPIRARSLHNVLTDRLQTEPLERNLYKIKQFVGTVVRDWERAHGRRRRERKPAAAKPARRRDAAA